MFLLVSSIFILIYEYEICSLKNKWKYLKFCEERVLLLDVGLGTHKKKAASKMFDTGVPVGILNAQSILSVTCPF